MPWFKIGIVVLIGVVAIFLFIRLKRYAYYKLAQRITSNFIGFVNSLLKIDSPDLNVTMAAEAYSDRKKKESVIELRSSSGFLSRFPLVIIVDCTDLDDPAYIIWHGNENSGRCYSNQTSQISNFVRSIKHTADLPDISSDMVV